jgi:uncharacterized OB-fold protein
MELKGKPLTDEEFKKGKVITVPWQPKAMYEWDTGSAMGRYLEGLKQGKILGVQCHKCKRIMWGMRTRCML